MPQDPVPVLKRSRTGPWGVRRSPRIPPHPGEPENLPPKQRAPCPPPSLPPSLAGPGRTSLGREQAGGGGCKRPPRYQARPGPRARGSHCPACSRGPAGARPGQSATAEACPRRGGRDGRARVRAQAQGVGSALAIRLDLISNFLQPQTILQPETD